MILNINNQAIFAFSDTHGNHHKLQVPDNADIIICAGDAVEDDLKGGEYDDFIEWLAGLDAKWKFFVPGNHELSFELGQEAEIVKKFEKAGICVLQDAVIDCNGVIIGSLSGNSFIEDGDIPTDLDVFVTHVPPYGILDAELGSPVILNFVLKAKPKYHLFGHIHATEGQEFLLGETRCVNVGVYNQLNNLRSV